MRVMLFHTAAEGPAMDEPPTPEMLEAFAAMDRLTEDLVAAGVFVAAARRLRRRRACRVLHHGGRRVPRGA